MGRGAQGPLRVVAPATSWRSSLAGTPFARDSRFQIPDQGPAIRGLPGTESPFKQAQPAACPLTKLLVEESSLSHLAAQ